MPGIKMVMERVMMTVGEWHDIHELLTTTLTSVHVLRDRLK